MMFESREIGSVAGADLHQNFNPEPEPLQNDAITKILITDNVLGKLPIDQFLFHRSEH
jgi:hypothetical protein